MEHFFETLNFEKVKIALNTNKQFTFLVRRKSVSIWYKDGGYTSFFKEDLYKRYTLIEVLNNSNRKKDFYVLDFTTSKKSQSIKIKPQNMK